MVYAPCQFNKIYNTNLKGRTLEAAEKNIYRIERANFQKILK